MTFEQTMIEIGGRWESIDSAKGLGDPSRCLQQGQKDIRFLLAMIRAYERELDDLGEELAVLSPVLAKTPVKSSTYPT